MTDLLLLIDDLTKFALVVGVMVLVATAPSQASATAHGLHTGAAQATMHDEDDEPSWGRRMLHTDDDERWLHSDDHVNLDGTPMCGDLDLNGNFYGDIGSAFDSWDGSTFSIGD
jgi:hypothetical protein